MKTEFSRRELYALGEPLGNSATRHLPGSRHLIYGGGGSSGQVKYENLEKLYEIQAQQGQQLMDMANKTVYPAFEQLMGEAKNTGSQANQEKAATQAAADTSAALGKARSQLSENLVSMGVNPSDPRFANTMANMELQGAAQGAAAQTGARERTQQLGYAKMKDATSMGMGIPSDAASALNSAGGFATTSANMQMSQMQMDQNSRSNIASLAGRMFLADGGEVKGARRLKCGGMVRGYKMGGEIKGYAKGGILGAMGGIKPPAPPASAPARSTGSGLVSGASQSATVGQGGAKLGGYIEKAGNALGSSDVASFGNGLRLGKDAAPAIDAYTGAAQAAGDTALGATAASNAASAGAAGVAEGVITEAGSAVAGEALGTALAAGETAGGLAGTASALGAGSAVAAALPWVGGAMLIGSALGLFKDGGELNKHRLMAADGTKGGAVSGPGGPKDDLVPIMGSDGEFMMPVGTVKLYGKERLEKMRQEGLAYEKKLGIGVAA